MTDVEGAGYVSWFHGGSQLARFWASNLEVMRPSVLALGLTEAVLEQALDALFDRERWLPSVMVVAAQGRRPTL